MGRILAGEDWTVHFVIDLRSSQESRKSSGILRCNSSFRMPRRMRLWPWEERLLRSDAASITRLWKRCVRKLYFPTEQRPGECSIR